MKMKTKSPLAFFLFFCAISLYSQKLSPTKEEKKILVEYASQMEPMVSISYDDAFAELGLKYKWHPGYTESLKSLLYRRELRKYARNYLDSIPRMRVAEKLLIDSLFQDSIDAILIPFNLDISEPAISIALGFANLLNLSDKKKKALQQAALNFAKTKRRFPKKNLAIEEMTILRNNLSNKDLETIIDMKNQSRASKMAQHVWDEMCRENIAYELDSVKQVSLARLFYKLEMRYHDMYVDDKDLLEKNLQDLYLQKPKIIRMFEALTERKRIKEKKKNSVGVQFAW